MHTQSAMQQLIAALTSLPGIGEKTATRLAMHLITCPKDKALQLASSITLARERVSLCSKCYNYTERELCAICGNPNRDAGVVCVVESPGDLLAVERSGSFRGQYHVLHGAIAPIDGIGPEQLKINELYRRIAEEPVREVILATNPTMNGNATAVFISEQLQSTGVTVTRIAQGIPAGGDIGYADQMTIKNALDGRKRIGGA